MHKGEHGEEKGRLEEGNSFYLSKIMIGKNVVEKNASTFTIGWWKSCLMYMDYKSSKAGVCEIYVVSC